MFEKFMQKLGKQNTKEETIEFKSYEELPEEPPKPELPQITEETEKSPRRQDSVELRVMRPETYDEVGAVADHLLEGCTVVLNVEVLDRATIVRMLDFLNGVTYCTEGEIKRVAQSTFIITPHTGVDISDM